MRSVHPFSLPGRWFRGNVHAHSTRSDGTVSVSQRCAGYRRAGYDFLVLTDHDLTGPVDEFCGEGFLTIPGAELHPDNPYGGERYHILALGVRENMDARAMHVLKVLEAIGAQGGIAVMAHPYWSGHQLSDYQPLRPLYCGIEIYNHTAHRLNNTGYAELLWDAHLDRLGSAWGFANDDSHRGDEEVGGGWNMVRAGALDEGSILQAMRTGAFYATQGPMIENIAVQSEGSRPQLFVRCSEARRISFKGRAHTGAVFQAAPGSMLREARYLAAGDEQFIRIEVEDPRGLKAWSNPIPLASL